MNNARIFAIGAAFCAGIAATPAEAANYVVSGTFQTLSGNSYETLAGGSFSGSFTLDDGYFPTGAGSSDYLYDAPFSIDIFNAAGTKVTTLANTPSNDSYLQIASSYADLYGGLRLFFRITSTDYLQLVMPLDFNGTGDIAAAGSSYALVLGGDYAYLGSGTVTSVPEPATWAMMLLGMGAIGLAARRSRPGAALNPIG